MVTTVAAGPTPTVQPEVQTTKVTVTAGPTVQPQLQTTTVTTTAPSVATTLTATATVTTTVTAPPAKLLAAVRFEVDETALATMQSDEGQQALSAALEAQFGLPVVILGSCLSTTTVNGRCPNSKSASGSRRLADGRHLATASLHIDFVVDLEKAKGTQSVSLAFQQVKSLSSGSGATVAQLAQHTQKEFKQRGMEIPAVQVVQAPQPVDPIIVASTAAPTTTEQAPTAPTTTEQAATSSSNSAVSGQAVSGGDAGGDSATTMIGAIGGVGGLLIMIVAGFFAKKYMDRRKEGAYGRALDGDAEEQRIGGQVSERSQCQGPAAPELGNPLHAEQGRVLEDVQLETAMVGTAPAMMAGTAPAGYLPMTGMPTTGTQASVPVEPQVHAPSPPVETRMRPHSPPTTPRQLVAKWEVHTDQGWMPWAPGVQFTAAPGAVTDYSMGRFKYQAVFSSEATGVQINLHTNKERALRRCEDNSVVSVLV